VGTAALALGLLTIGREPCNAATELADTEHAKFWDDAAVVYAEVNDYQRPNGKGAVIEFWPIATLTGALDSALSGKITATADIGTVGARILRVPANGSKVVVLLERKDAASGQSYRVPNAPIEFFPANENGDHPAMFEVNGVDDARVQKAVTQLRELRSRHRNAVQ